MDILTTRQSFGCPSGYYYSSGRCYPSSWYYWGRWVFAAIVIVFFIIVFFLLACISNRRRRRRGMAPMYGTGWMGNYNPGYGGGWTGGNNKYNGQQPQQGAYYNAPPPQYSANAAAQPMPNQYTGQTFNSGEGYYGHHNDIQLQQPSQSYHPRAAENTYDPPEGPPPAKK